MILAAAERAGLVVFQMMDELPKTLTFEFFAQLFQPAPILLPFPGGGNNFFLADLCFRRKICQGLLQLLPGDSMFQLAPQGLIVLFPPGDIRQIADFFSCQLLAFFRQSLSGASPLLQGLQLRGQSHQLAGCLVVNSFGLLALNQPSQLFLDPFQFQSQFFQPTLPLRVLSVVRLCRDQSSLCGFQIAGKILLILVAPG
ncbi:hypothetical protein DSECCO2_281800 [anaerobic digester metagenome]